MSDSIDGFMNSGGTDASDAAASAVPAPAATTASIPTATSSIQTDANNVGSNMVNQAAAQPAPAKSSGMGGMMGGGKKSAAPISGGNAAGQAAPTALSTEPANQNAKSKPSALGDLGKLMTSKPQPSSSARVDMPGNSYSAIFGTQTQTGNFGGGQIGVQNAQPMAQAPAPQMPQIPQAPMAAPPPPPPPAPMPMQSVSDVRAKYRIQSKIKSNNELNTFLQSVYNNVISKGKSK